MLRILFIEYFLFLLCRNQLTSQRRVSSYKIEEIEEILSGHDHENQERGAEATGCRFFNSDKLSLMDEEHSTCT